MPPSLFLLIGFFVGTIGTIIGAGGGFLLSPIFLLLYPITSPQLITAISLAAVAANSVSGTLGYAYRKTIHWPSVFLFSILAIPGVIFGIYLTRITERNAYNFIFGISLLILSLFLFFRKSSQDQKSSSESTFWNKKTKLVGSAISIFIGIVSSLLGIGGGIIHVPLLSEFLKYPMQIATGTSQAILAITSLVAVADHYRLGVYSPLDQILPYLCIGLILGAQLGAFLSSRISTTIIKKVLCFALFIVGMRFFISGIRSF
jgi:uncharacterized membrane protein YfcA